MSTRKVASLDPYWSDFVGPSAVGARTILEDAASYLLLQDRFERVHDLFRDERNRVFVTRGRQVSKQFLAQIRRALESQNFIRVVDCRPKSIAEKVANSRF